MEHWRDQGIVLALRAHGEGGAILKILSEHHGVHAGYIHGASSQKKRALLEPGNLLHLEWSAKTTDHLGHFTFEPVQQLCALIMDDKYKLSALHALTSLLEITVPERESYTSLYQTSLACITVMAHTDHHVTSWAESYIKWEIALLKDLGFSLDFSKCAGGGDPQTLAYISPKSGCAVSYEKGEPYKDKLLPLPGFLKPNRAPCTEDDVETGLRITTTFLEKWVFAQTTTGMPEARANLTLGGAGLSS